MEKGTDEHRSTPALPRPSAIVFDLDGTLVDSAADLAAAVNDVLGDRALPTHGVATIRTWIGEGADRLIERALAGGDPSRAPTHDAIAAALVDFRRVYAAGCTRSTTLYPGAQETLAALRERRLPTAILTNKPANQTATILRHFGLDRLVDAWIGGDSELGRKPDPRALCELARRLCRGAPPAMPHIWLVGDSITDIRTARAAGGTAIVVRGGYDDADPIDRCTPRPDWIAAGLGEVLGLADDAIVRSR